jgi:hypothetical protein
MFNRQAPEAKRHNNEGRFRRFHIDELKIDLVFAERRDGAFGAI